MASRYFFDVHNGDGEVIDVNRTGFAGGFNF